MKYIISNEIKMDRIVIDSRIRHGKPIVKGTRITVEEILGSLIGGMTYDEIEKEYGVKKEDILATIEYATSFISGEVVRPLKIKDEVFA